MSVIMSMEAAPAASLIKMYVGNDEMLRIAEDGFYVRGTKVPADEKEALAVYNSFKQWLVYHNLVRR